ncbi:prefoldin subunit 1 [Capronia coronata CBS 617.96]|uniref:Prefoldin subunit 1 n=1 Tax=Capronia coronata CBS 617.96 TaxID=1182541 RepID=W9YXU9_9EURO|nr:prefoldin subunit 1 [Capronia coronata CBS 617.96]EXJ94101.1 prefoldin subunit 1 [Capronia coronata CBS 617.96]
MAIPNVALQKLLQEVETQAILSQQKITQTQAELSAKRRDARLNHLTSDELKSLSDGTNVYEGVGKMFVAVPISTLNQRLTSEASTLNKDISDLEKRLHYQETTYKNSRQHIEKILQSGSA